MSWLLRRKQNGSSIAKLAEVDRKLAAVDRQLIDQAARLVRLEAEIAPYTLLRKDPPQ